MDKIDYNDEIKIGFEVNTLIKKITHPILLSALHRAIEEQIEDTKLKIHIKEE